LHVSNELLNKCKDFWSVDDVQIEWTLVLFLVVLVISFVSDFFLLNLSDFLDFIVIDVEYLSIEGLLVELSFSLSSIVWIFETNKGIYSFAFWFAENFDIFDFSEFSKVLSEFLFRSLGWEVLDIKIASLL
jgi:sensor histidine kinase YesM